MMPMFQRVANAIREVDTNHILFLETSMFCNMGVLSAVEPLTLADGSRDPLQAYAPHGYDIVVDTASLADASLDRITFIFDQHAKTADRLNMPMLIGEWGAYYGSDKVVTIAQHTMGQFRKHRASDTYWDFHKGIEETAFFKVLSPPVMPAQ
ncbi:MAG: glycoside hydrolase family 5 protein [bacterium]|nr:glycoside hydrolase family 5 protein [bacterium]